MSPRTLHLVPCWLMLGLLFSCAQSTPNEAEDKPVLQTTATVEAGELTLRFDRQTMRTVDRAVVTLILRTKPGFSGETELPDLEADGWGVVHIAALPAVLGRDGWMTYSTRVTVEPFLEGDYTIGAARARWRSLVGDDAGEVSTDSLSVRVDSVLDDPAGLDLEGPVVRGELPPLVKRRSVLGAVAIGMGVAGLVGAGVLGMAWRFWRRRRRAVPTPGAQLSTLARSLDTTDPETISRRLNAIVRTAWANDQMSPETRGFLDRLDRARYSGRAIGRGEVEGDLRAAMTLFGGGV